MWEWSTHEIKMVVPWSKRASPLDAVLSALYFFYRGLICIFRYILIPPWRGLGSLFCVLWQFLGETVRATYMDLYTIWCTIESDFIWFDQKCMLIWIVCFCFQFCISITSFTFMLRSRWNKGHKSTRCMGI